MQGLLFVAEVLFTSDWFDSLLIRIVIKFNCRAVSWLKIEGKLFVSFIMYRIVAVIRRFDSTSM